MKLINHEISAKCVSSTLFSIYVFSLFLCHKNAFFSRFALSFLRVDKVRINKLFINLKYYFVVFFKIIWENENLISFYYST